MIHAGFSCGCIDIHTHVVPEHFPAYAGKHSNVRWPSTVPAHACHRHVMMSGSVYRTVADACWDETKRMQAMDEQRVDRQVLSPMPELLSYWLATEDGANLARFLNESIAEMVASAPDRFVGLGTVPLQHVDTAIGELEFLVEELGLAGVEIGTNVNGVVLGDPCLSPFFDAAERLGAAIFVHPLRPVGTERLVGDGLVQILAFPGETGLAAASLVTSGLMLRHPRLRIAFSHGGGTLASLLPRLQHGWEVNPALRDSMPVAPAEVVRLMYYDNLVYETDALRRLIHCFGESQICAGTDYPFRIRERDPVGRIEGSGLSDRVQAQLCRLNAERWLGMAAGEPG
ncbi:amidohydrolase family protein [Pigmentiphaga sp.]|uniref:amidohydrolase family protein n=1 Tax=Pigmentiphaga sp. TaxID=1977564 RepID=UPI00128CAD0B|nr:amidohydrolase family protein [Pigmentiphaga sp.]MPS25759.1 amidohydrolase [Alcaligenaceae bacterium SAGV5]MPS54423.1 amidohydrolase [Alcaligenaceae bacterium SAGV3]MPT58563.1 amidohydrolase [Alcaligenaceae bacterium]